MKVLVTGATGLLGANVVETLLARGKEVRVLVRASADLRALKGLDPEVFRGDILDKESLSVAMKGCDSVVHAAANTSQWPTGFEFYEPVNVTGTRNVMEVCRERGISRIVYVSSANAFGHGSKENPGTELSEFRGFHFGSGYMISKFLAQKIVLEEVGKRGAPAIIVNPAFMIGARDARPSSGRIILMGYGRKTRLFPDGGKNFIHVADAAAGVCNALERGRVGECYLLANENLTFREFYDKLDRVDTQKPVRIKVPVPVLRGAGWAGTVFETITGKPAPLNNVNAKLLTVGNYYSGEKAVTELGLPRTPIEKAISDALAWFRDQGMV